MFITQVLCLKRLKWLPKVRPHGHLYRGKDRWVRSVNLEEIRHTKAVLDIEERNMFYLRHPFLSAEEYRNVGRDYVKSYYNLIIQAKARRMQNFVKSIEDRKKNTFFHQRVNKSNRWE